MRSAWSAKRVVVVGAGRSGTAAARFLCANGANVLMVDRDPRKLQDQALHASASVGDEEWGAEQVRSADLVVTSPGVPPTNPVLRRAQQLAVPILSEIELAFRELKVPVVAVTGTNGKSTTTTLIGEMCRQAGMKVFVGGNLGTPLIEAAGHPEYSVAVVEVSSFQLEWVEEFRPAIGVFLNLSPDHLDRYPNLDAYGEAKLRLFARQTTQDFAILNRMDPWIWSRRQQIPATTRWFGGCEGGLSHAWIEGEFLHVADGRGDAWCFALSEASLAGQHNRENMMAAVLAARCLALPFRAVKHALAAVRPLPHRLEFVREWRGVRFYDDSKGTNVGAVQKSLASFDQRVILLAGGYDKESDFRCVIPQLREHVRYAIFFGAAAGKWAEQTGEFVPHTVVPSLRQAVEVAAAIAEPGDVVLLSPGCASFDEFEDYAHRGRCFREWVEAL
ncbi:MAG: UDP-N-acetylmuramoyl-L-alanine--D-glutamate ligase [Candidatus Binatia bacterium]|nr:UDP-N-acetylmuramoyl-L-alanine--D-glutamate ligase [Candidatus Binatia bacterium]